MKKSKKSILKIKLSFFIILIALVKSYSQSDNCVVGSSTLLTPGAAGAACAPVAYNTNSGFTDSNQGCTQGTEDDDGWFRFTATATSHTITVNGAANMDAVLGVYSNCAGTQPTGGACVDATAGDGNETRTITGLTIGAEYYICVHDWNAGGGDFTICITTPAAPPGNDDCVNATNLPCGTTNLAGTTANTVSETPATGCTYSNYGVWYTFTGDGQQTTITTSGGTLDVGIAIASGTCASKTNIACIDVGGAGGTDTYTFTTVNGTTYFVYISYYNGGTTTGTFNISRTCAAPPAPSCATYTGPNDGAEICNGTTSVTMSWDAVAGVTGYNFYFGTNNPPTNIVNGTFQTTTDYVYSGLTDGFTYYWQVIPTNGSTPASNCALQSFRLIPCINMSNGTFTTCQAGFYDSGGPGPTGSAADNSNIVQTFCPANAGECIQATFYGFGTESGTDLLYVYDGNTTAAPQLAGSPFSGNLPAFSVVGSTTNATGCLTFRYTSNSSFQSSGWDASLICAPCATAATYPPQDCAGGITVCSDQAFAGNSDGQGIINDLNSSNEGCLSAEHQTSWYYFSPATSGTIQLAITPANGTDDYDFAIWGPMASVSCPPASTPLRCSYSALDGITGLNLTAADVSEGVGGDKWVDELNVTAGQVYILCVDNYSASTQPFTLDWTLTNGATLNCTPLPIELLSFKGQQDGKKNLLEWITASEINNDFFTIEKSTDGQVFSPIGIVDGAGTSNQNRNYKFYDNEPKIGINYYRIKQTDFDGTSKYSGIIGITYVRGEQNVTNIRPNPTSNDVYFDFFSPISGIINVEVLDYIGRTVLNEKMSVSEGQTSLNAKIGELPKGIYSLKVTFAQTGYRSVNMIIKQ